MNATKFLLIIGIILITIPTYAQEKKYNYLRSDIATFTSTELQNAQDITDLLPHFWDKLILPYDASNCLKSLINLKYPEQIYLAHKKDYSDLLICNKLEIEYYSNGLRYVVATTSSKLTPEQKKLIASANNGEAINFNVQIQLKQINKCNFFNVTEINRGGVTARLVPHMQASYNGGLTALNNYIFDNIVLPTTNNKQLEKLNWASVSFVIDTIGNVTNIKLSSSTKNADLDKLIINTINKMPTWISAKDENNKAVNQAITLYLGSNGGC